MSSKDKRRRTKSPARASTESNPDLQTRSSSESIRSDSSVTSGQLTPSEAMVYASPVITHENVFENAFQRAEDKVRLEEGENTVVYHTWRSEEMRGQPITNRYGRSKVELERVDSKDESDPRPRWERVLDEKFPEKLAELYQRKGERITVIKEAVGTFKEKSLRDRAHTQLNTIRGVQDKESPTNDAQSEHKESHPPSKGWEKLLGGRAHKQFDTARGLVNSLSGTTNVPETTEPPTEE